MDILLQYKVAVNALNNKVGQSCLYVSSYKCCKCYFKIHATLVISKSSLNITPHIGPDPHIHSILPPTQGQTPLHYAAFSHHGALCMELLVKAGADPNVQDSEGRTPLHMTALHGFYLRTETLIRHGMLEGRGG